MKILNIYASSRSLGNAFEKRGHEVYDIRYQDFCHTENDIIELCNGKPDIILFIPECKTYSIAGLHFHRIKNEISGNLIPKTKEAMNCDNLNIYILDLIKKLSPKYYFIENPMGGMRKMNFMKDLNRYTVTYCQYGDTRMKPTDIWTNHKNPRFKPMCHNGDPCHQSSPRGSRSGTQRLKLKSEKAKIPEELCNHIVDISEEE